MVLVVNGGDSGSSNPGGIMVLMEPASTGGGGGGATGHPMDIKAGAGGSGIVIVRYKIGELTAQLQKQLVVPLVSMVIRQFILSQHI